MRRLAAPLIGGVLAAALLHVAPLHAAALGDAPLSFVIDAERSEITFTVGRPGEIIEGIAPGLSGEIVVDPERPGVDPSVVVRIEAAAMKTGNRLRDRKMRNKHLESGRFPEILFRSTSIEISAGEGGDAKGPLAEGESRRALVEGVLDLHGVQRSILCMVSIRYDCGLLNAEGKVSFRLTDHDIPIPRFLWLVLDDEVTISFRLVAGPKAATRTGGMDQADDAGE